MGKYLNALLNATFWFLVPISSRFLNFGTIYSFLCITAQSGIKLIKNYLIKQIVLCIFVVCEES